MRTRNTNKIAELRATLSDPRFDDLDERLENKEFLFEVYRLISPIQDNSMMDYIEQHFDMDRTDDFMRLFFLPKGLNYEHFLTFEKMFSGEYFDFDDAHRALNRIRVDVKVLFEDPKLLLFWIKGEKFVIVDEGDESEMMDVYTFLQYVDDSRDPLDFVEDDDDELWGQLWSVYHGTTERNAQRIEEEGIGERNQTRGMSNRSTGSAVFTSEDVDELVLAGYEAMFEVSVASMRADGYNYRAEREPDIARANAMQKLAHALGVDDYESEVESGMSPSTVIIYGSIPPQYLTRMDWEF